MKRPQDLALDMSAMHSLVDLTSVFEGIASMRIAQIKSQVLQSQDFFSKLWHIYTQIRVDDLFRFGVSEVKKEYADKDLIIVVTAEGGFSGDIDQKLIAWMLKSYDKKKQDIIVVGHHGAVQLAQQGVSFKKYYKLPEKDQNINVSPIIGEVQKYHNTVVYYQTYVTLMVQDIKRIELGKAVEERAKELGGEIDDVISEETYIFEPTTFAVVDHLERSMLSIALSQVILESKLAQYASRFRAMTAAHDLADESFTDIKTMYNHARRMLKDERLKEILNGIRKVAV
jgi:ATP synthase F1 gamma subunit